MNDIAFFDDLNAPLYPQDTVWSTESVAGEGEFAIDPGWRIAAPVDASGQVLMAAEDLSAFLGEAGIVVAVGADDGATGTIVLRQGQGDGEAESFAIHSTPGSIVIEGADDSGIMYGVFHLEELLRFRAAPIMRTGVVKRRPVLHTRILRSPMSFFHCRELPTVLDAYPETYLQKMAHHGFNGLWLRGMLGRMVKTKVFPEFGEEAELIQASMNELVRRAAKFGVRVYLYFNEPLAVLQDDPFWETHQHLKGQPHESEKVFGLCTSTPEVREFLREGMRTLFAKVQGLAGVLLITASEFHTHCYSHFGTRGRPAEEWKTATGVEGMLCERCRHRTPQEVIGELVGCISDGIHASNPDAEVICWNWSWGMYEEDPQASVINALPPEVCVMGDFERGGKRVTDGFDHVVDEYSLTYIGPGERFQGTAEVARAGDRRLFAKLQIGTTHEVGSVPHFPQYHKIAEKFRRLREQEATGAMECWNFGNILSHNTEVANWYSWAPFPESTDELLTKMASRDYGQAAAPAFVEAWSIFSKATDHYPFSIPLLYWGPQHFGPAYPLFFEKVDRHMPIPWLLPAEVKYDTEFSWMDYTDFGDEIANYLGGFTAEKLVSCFDNLVDEWGVGVARIEAVLGDVPERLRAKAESEHAVCAAVLSQFTTVRNVTEFTTLRNAYLDETDMAVRRTQLARMIEIAENEVENAAACLPLIPRNPMLGFHGEAFGYDYTSAKIEAKLTFTRGQIDLMQAALVELG